jgi:hypothetical protein
MAGFLCCSPLEQILMRDTAKFLVSAAAACSLIAPVGALVGNERAVRAQERTTHQDDGAGVRTMVKLPEPKGAKRLSPQYDIWIDPKEKAVLVDGQISLREGMLEMFACTRNTKEHESIVSANTKAYLVHAALLSLGAEPGKPAQFVPEYRPPSGTEIEVLVRWIDEKGKPHSARAQDWVKDIRTGKAMTQPFVFAGSSFWTDAQTGKRHYQAEGGDFICVSNFSTAMLDIPVESSQSNTELAFEAFSERIPPLGAPVRLVLKPIAERSEKRGTSDKAGAGGPTSTDPKSERK